MPGLCAASGRLVPTGQAAGLHQRRTDAQRRSADPFPGRGQRGKRVGVPGPKPAPAPSSCRHTDGDPSGERLQRNQRKSCRATFMVVGLASRPPGSHFISGSQYLGGRAEFAAAKHSGTDMQTRFAGMGLFLIAVLSASLAGCGRGSPGTGAQPAQAERRRHHPLSLWLMHGLFSFTTSE